ncbi:MAG: AAA family ATPase [Pirellulaceae bacterium]|nr:AAA family ATPase [Pirellulaceae bacterium]
MITRIELTNFMSHAHTVIEPAAGLTVIVGPNNCGKSAVVAALQVLCRNDPAAYVVRHETKECTVAVETSDGHKVVWSRKAKGSPKYIIDGQQFDRLGKGGVPDELHRALRLPEVEGTKNAALDVHFGGQKSPIFLLDQPAAEAARFFASSSDASRLVEMQRRHKVRVADRQKDKNRLEAESRQVNGELETLQPVVEIDKHLKTLEAAWHELTQLAGQIAAAERAAAALAAQSAVVVNERAVAGALAPLTAPPALAPTEPLARQIEQLQSARHSADALTGQVQALQELAAPPTLADERALAKAIAHLEAASANAASALHERDALVPLVAPPVLADEAALAGCLAGLAAAQGNVAAQHGRLQALALVSPPPALVESGPLGDAIGRLDQAARQVDEFRRQLVQAEAEQLAAAAELRAWATDGTCPTCGAPLNADRLLAHAAAGLGGHAHG